MNPTDLDQLLKQTLADHRIQAGEKQALIDWMAHNAPDDANRSLARSRAFALAKSELAGEAMHVLEWLEETIRVFSRPIGDSSAAPEASRAFFSPGATCVQEVIREFHLARKSSDVCVFTITDDRITDAILAAHTRGVKVRIITDDDKSHDLGSDIDRLRAAGIPCKMDEGNAAHMHHKFALFDGHWLLNGSFNWTRSASEQNEENLIVTADPVLVAAFTEHFEWLWLRTT
ncbi:MAG TPA: phospholipase D-like domain-containing protein [Gemmataceae bacterium]|jgi:phosphatidylserine/phosphatidylglycerophosphate/cardiolipin synthase-like enzyme|nr:phospholipase D-like domain-containing protein [Gemmataceae bacterium]